MLIAFWKIDGFDVRPRMPRSTHAGQLAAGEPTAAEVVEPGALAERRAARAGGCASGSLEALQVAQQRPRSFGHVLGGEPELGQHPVARGRRAEALDRRPSRPPTGPSPRDTPASTDRVGTSGGRTSSCTSSGCSSSSSQQASDVTWAWTPSAASSSAAATATCTSLPGGDQHEVGVFGGAQHVGASRQAHPGGALEHRQVLPREDQRGGPVVLDGQPPRLGRLVGVGRAGSPGGPGWRAAR